MCSVYCVCVCMISSLDGWRSSSFSFLGVLSDSADSAVVAANSPHVYSLSDAVFAVAAVVGEKRAVEKVQCFFSFLSSHTSLSKWASTDPRDRADTFFADWWWLSAFCTSVPATVAASSSPAPVFCSFFFFFCTSRQRGARGFAVTTITTTDCAAIKSGRLKRSWRLWSEGICVLALFWEIREGV